METPIGDDIITNSDESRRLPDENPEPLEGIKREESTLLEAESKSEKKEDKKSTETKNNQKEELK